MVKNLYHGSPKNIEDVLIPKKGRDLGHKEDNLHEAVYATDKKEYAIIMAILKSEGVRGSSLDFETGEAIVYKGWPKQKEIYVYHLSKEGFKPTSTIPHQFISLEPAIPIKTERIGVQEYIHLIKKASKEETRKWLLEHYIY